MARNKFLEKICELGDHPGCTIIDCGLVVPHNEPHLAATPDGILQCDCHGRIIIEIKCPYSHRNKLVMDAAREDRSFPLRIERDEEGEENLVVDKNHQYYYQCQLQMYVTGTKLCYFIIYTLKELSFFLIEIDPGFLNSHLPKAKLFWKQCVIPEIFARFFTAKEQIVTPTTDSHLPCFCQTKNDDLEAVICARNDCERKVFHVSCVKSQMNMKRVLKGKWLCDLCRKVIAKEKRDANKQKVG